MSKTKKVTISLTPQQQDKARFFSKDLFGKENIFGLIGFLIERWEKEKKRIKCTGYRISTSVALAHNDPNKAV